MGRIFLILVLLAVSLTVVKLIKNKLDRAADKQRAKLEKDSTRGKMVKCLHCGLHIPEEEAIKQGDKVFCSLEHAGQEI